jgi:hypothetical protein
MFILNRSLVYDDSKVKRFINACNNANLEIIELLWNQFSEYPNSVWGFDIPKFVKNESADVLSSVLNNHTMFNGKTYFNPDNDGRCWAYIVDTENNRAILINSFVDGWFSIVDNKLREELILEAKRQAKPVEAAAKPNMNLKMTTREEQALKQLAKEQEKMRKIEQEKILLEDKIKNLQAMADTGNKTDEEFVSPPPLKGIKLSPEVRANKG